eukprot:02377.XXX_7185_7304_1 [CDS] Oithona nana genome sequencing.
MTIQKMCIQKSFGMCCKVTLVTLELLEHFGHMNIFHMLS